MLFLFVCILQCLSLSDMCDDVSDCLKNEDENMCDFVNYYDATKEAIAPPAIINFPRPQILIGQSHLHFSALSFYNSTCPETHFQCPGHGYCLPVFLRCNNVNDCPGREDEIGCDSGVSCPGFYACSYSSVCLHPSHVCDTIYQCPQHDDELFCSLACPAGCTCHGLDFKCHKSFRPELHTTLRYLDASGSGMKPPRLTENIMLIHLSLSRCGIYVLSNMTFPNLHSLDLSNNELHDVTSRQFQGMKNLHYLSLSENPIKSLFRPHDLNDSLSTIRTLDVSGVKMQALNTRIFSAFSGLQTLNLSNCGVDRVSGQAFDAMTTSLLSLDMVGCPMTKFRHDLLAGLDKLQAVYADNFKLCCPHALPAAFKLSNCRAPFDEISSCESLLRSEFYVACLSVYACLALLGNFGCFLVRNVYLNSGTSGFAVFVTHLSVSDFLMGVYLAVIGVADRLYKGSYVWEDITWRNSAICTLAGFISLLSNEMSAFIICLITLDRFLVLRFPFSRLHFKARSAHITCAVVWILAIFIAVIPLTPMTSHWSFYSQTGICIPLPVTRRNFAGRHYAFGILIIFNFVLFVLISLGQATIYFSVRANSLPSCESTKKSTTDLRIARRLISVAVSDFLCWFPIGLLGLLASSGVPISGEVNVGMAILVLPLNSAINPFLYTVNIVLERRRRSRDEHVLKMLMADYDNA